MSIVSAAGTAINRAARAALDAVLPPQCLSCASVTDAPGTLCAACWSKITWLGAPLFACLGAPFEFYPQPRANRSGLICGAFLWGRTAFPAPPAPFLYCTPLRSPHLRFEH